MSVHRETSDFEARMERIAASHLDTVLGMMAQTLEQYTPSGSTLTVMAGYQLATGGKRLRAILPLAVAEALGVPAGRVLPFAAACEMLHNATLVHDDLQDGDEWRRGRAAVWREFGSAQAINLGDAMFYYAVLLCHGLDCSAEVKLNVSQALLTATLRVIDGQERELALRHTVPSRADYLQMIEGKTSAMFSLGLVGTAMLAGEPRERYEHLEQAGRHLGVLFQVQDDLLDLYGNKGRKRVGCDVAEGKASVLFAVMGERASAVQLSTMRQILSKSREETTDTDVDVIRGLVHETGALAGVIEILDGARRRTLDSVTHSPGLKELLAELCDVVLAPIRDVLHQQAL